MYGMIYKFCVLFFIVSQTVAAQNVRKYNLEEEALKLYKQDFKSVLKRFRRTSDYLKILEDKLADLKTSTKDMSLQVFNYFHDKMEKQVVNVLSGQPGNIRLDRNSFRTDDRAETPPSHIPEEDWKKINELDQYSFFNSHLSMSERNSLKELGFSYAGQVIHSIVRNLKPVTNSDEDNEKFTKTYEGESGKKTTTEHPEIHQITYWKYAFDEDAPPSDKKIKPLEITEKTTSVEESRFRALMAPAKGNLTVLRKHNIMKT